MVSVFEHLDTTCLALNASHVTLPVSSAQAQIERIDPGVLMENTQMHDFASMDNMKLISIPARNDTIPAPPEMERL